MTEYDEYDCRDALLDIYTKAQIQDREFTMETYSELRGSNQPPLSDIAEHFGEWPAPKEKAEKIYGDDERFNDEQQ